MQMQLSYLIYTHAIGLSIDPNGVNIDHDISLSRIRRHTGVLD
jgi:hypothetical protein